MVKPVVVAPTGIDCHIVNPTGWALLSDAVSLHLGVWAGDYLLVLHDIPLLVSLRMVRKEVKLTIGGGKVDLITPHQPVGPHQRYI